jgi:aspartate/methionine/tyrosine aminotransferase
MIVYYIQTGIELDHYPDFKDDTTFVTELIAEQGVTCMPGSVNYTMYQSVL